MGQPLYTYTVKDAKQIHDDWIRTVKNGLISIVGIPNPNVGPNSDYDVQATAFGNEMAVVQANAVIQADNNLPDTAAGVWLDRWLALFGLSRNPALGSFGVTTITTSVATTFIATGAQLTDSAGLRYQVTVGGNYGPALFGIPPVPTGVTPQVPVSALDVGKATNHANGDVLTWVSAPFATQANTSVGTTGGSDGLAGGADSEVGNDEPPRSRLLALLQNPPLSGNAAAVALWAARSTPDVQACGVYPALLGPGTVFFAVWGEAQTAGTFSSTSKNRDLPAALLNGTVIPYVQGLYPEHALVAGTSVVNVPTDVSLLLSLPSAPTASPSGPGGGWVDGSPWPQSVGGTAACVVTGVTSSSVITVNAATAPTPGVSSIAWVSPLTWLLYTAHVVSFTGGSGAYVITLDTPMPGIALGNFIFPQSVQQANYLTALFQGFANLGCGEWATIPGVLSRSYRHPLPTLAWPYSLDANFLRVMENAGPEVANAQWIYRSQTTPVAPGQPTVGAAPYPLTSTPPGILVPRNLAIYQQ